MGNRRVDELLISLKKGFSPALKRSSRNSWDWANVDSYRMSVIRTMSQRRTILTISDSFGFGGMSSIAFIVSKSM